MSSQRVDAVYTSPLERARETAAPIGTATGLRPRSIVVCWSASSASGRARAPAADEEARVADRARAPSTFRFPGGESFSRDAAPHRVDPRSAAGVASGGTIVCVSHADPIKAAVAHALGTHLDLFQRIVISTCAVSIIAWSQRRPGRPGRELHRRLAARAAAVMTGG